jgi:hypothetical protein
VTNLKDVPGMTYERLVRIQRGETLMQFADLMAWSARFEQVRDLLLSPISWPSSTPSKPSLIRRPAEGASAAED